MPAYSRGRSATRSTSANKRSRAISRSTSSRSTSRNTGLTSVNRGWPYNSLQGKYFDPFPAKMSAVLRYSQNIKLDPSTISPVRNFFNATSCYDPDATAMATGHQPYGFDQYSLLFNHYIVDKAIITVRNASVASNTVFGISLVPNTQAENDPNTVRERKGTTWMACPNEMSQQVLKSTYNKKAVFTSAQDSELTAPVTANPDENYYFDVWTVSNQSTNPPATTLAVDITYFVTFSEPKQLNGS